MHPTGAADAKGRPASLFAMLFQIPTPNLDLTLKRNMIFFPLIVPMSVRSDTAVGWRGLYLLALERWISLPVPQERY